MRLVARFRVPLTWGSGGRRCGGAAGVKRGAGARRGDRRVRFRGCALLLWGGDHEKGVRALLALGDNWLRSVVGVVGRALSPG